MTWLVPKLFIAVALLVVAMVIFARARRGKPRRRGSSAQLGNAFQNIEGLFVESKKHAVEARQEPQSEEDDSGEPPEK